MLDYFGQNIESMVERLGRDITVRDNTKSGPDYDPVLTPVDVTARAAVFDYDASEVDSTTIQRSDKEFIIASSSTILKTSKLVDGGKTYQIISLEEVQPGSELLMYIAQGRA